MTLGDAGLEHEVLAMFSAQSAKLARHAGQLPPEAAALAHTLKGSARAIGALWRWRRPRPAGSSDFRRRDTAEALAELGDAVALARTAIEAILRRS